MDIIVNHKTVIAFDLDDTLYNELEYLKSAYQSIASNLEPGNCLPLYAKMFSLYRNDSNVFKFITDAYPITHDVLISMYRNHVPNIKPFGGVVKLFKAIKSKGGKIVIITDGRSKTQREKLKSLRLVQYIDSIIISEEIGTEKPSLENFKAVENSFTKMQYYYIADNVIKDFIAPNALGWKTIMLIDNGKNIHFQSNEVPIQNLPQHYVLNFNEVKVI